MHGPLKSVKFTVETTPRLIFEKSGATRAGGLAKELGFRRPLVITDAGNARVGLSGALGNGVRVHFLS